MSGAGKDNMARLIDVDNYCNTICNCNRRECDKEKCPIHTAPTAYDVDKVVEQLEDSKCIKPGQQMDDEADVAHDYGIYKAIEIVKAGGIDNK